MGTIVIKIFQTNLEVEIMVSGFGGTRKCFYGAEKGGWELNNDNDLPFWETRCNTARIRSEPLKCCHKKLVNYSECMR